MNFHSFEFLDSNIESIEKLQHQRPPLPEAGA
jgi:hypothetical protein